MLQRHLIALLILIPGLISVVPGGWGQDARFSESSTLEGIITRGQLRISLEVGYIPFEMIDKRSGVR